jgi:hypothetical protein
MMMIDHGAGISQPIETQVYTPIVLTRTPKITARIMTGIRPQRLINEEDPFFVLLSGWLFKIYPVKFPDITFQEF